MRPVSTYLRIPAGVNLEGQVPRQRHKACTKPLVPCRRCGYLTVITTKCDTTPCALSAWSAPSYCSPSHHSPTSRPLSQTLPPPRADRPRGGPYFLRTVGPANLRGGHPGHRYAS